MPEPRGRGTEERILDAAERLFAEQGFAATSLRRITSAAGVNLAGVNYHFGSKEALIEAALARRLEPINRERLELLAGVESRAGARGPAVEEIVEAFVGPPLRMRRDPGSGGEVVVRLLGHAMNQPQRHVRRLLLEQFAEVARRFVAALSRVLAPLPREEVMWRLVFVAGAMAHTMALYDDLDAMTDGLCDTADVETTIRRLVLFLSAALVSPAPLLPTRRRA